MYAVFMDRDGTIGGTGDWEHPLKFELYEDAPEAIKLLKNNGIKVFIFTNQGRISQGYFKEEELHIGFNQIQKKLAEVNTSIDGFYYCPHQEKEGCNCNKPRPGMLIRAKYEHNLESSKCYVVGDKGHRDMKAADAVGMNKVLVKTGWGERSITSHRHLWEEINADYVSPNILDSANWIIEDIKSKERELTEKINRQR